MKLELKRFADYWDKASPGNVDEIVFTPIKEPATRVAALLAGDVDFIAPVPPTDLARIKDDPCCTLITMPSTRVLTFELNQDRVARLQGHARAARHELRHQPRGDRAEDHARLRPPPRASSARPAMPATIPRSPRATISTRPRR